MSKETFFAARIFQMRCPRFLLALLLCFLSIDSYAITVTASGKSDVYVGETAGYFITVGPTSAFSEPATLDYALPAGTTYSSSSTSQGTCSFSSAGGTGNGALHCDLGTITSTQSASVSVDVQLNSIGDSTSNFSVTASILIFTRSGVAFVPDPGSASALTHVHDFPVVSLVTSSGDASEPSTNGEFSLTLNEPVLPGYDNTFTVGLTVDSSSTATEGKDFAALPRTVRIPYRATQVAVPVPVIDDNLVEGTEVVNARLVIVPSGMQYSLGKNSSASLKILDNDLPPPNVNISVLDGDAGEPNNSGSFQITSDQPAGPNGLLVPYAIGGTAGADKDYVALTSIAFINPGATSTTITVDPLDNNIYDGPTPRTVILTLKARTNYTFVGGKPPSAQLVIKDNELPPVATVLVSDSDAGEPSNVGVFAISLDQPAGPGDVSVSYAVSGNAVANKDYVALNGTVVIPAGKTGASVTVTPIDDQIYNGPAPRVVTVTLTSGSGYSVGKASADSLTIKDNELPPLPTATLAVTDGDIGEPNNNGTLTVNIDQVAPTGGLALRYVVSGSAVAGKDYSTLSGQLSIPAGGRSGTITIAPIDDQIYNGPNPRTVTVALVDITSAHFYNVGKPSDATVTIKDNETPPLPVATLAISDSDAGEPNNPGQFQIKLNTAPGGNGLTINYNVSGSAVAGKDYQSLSGTVTFGPQATSANIDVNPIDDLIYNGPNPRVVSVTLGAGTGYNVGTANNGSITIKDNETPPLPVVTLAIADGDVGEPSNNGTLTVNLDQPAPAGGLVVRYNVSGTAVAGKDYSTLPGQVTIPANNRSANIDIAPIDDLIYNGPTPRTVTVALVDIAAARTYNLGKPSDASVTIKDNETPPLPIATLAVSDGDAGEPNNPGQFQIKLDTAPGGNGLTINYNITGSAVAGKDYQSLSGTVTFGPQATSANIDVNPIDDQIYNGPNPRVVSVTLGSGTGYNVGAANNGSITIKDNETPPLPVATLSVTDGIVGEPNNNGTLTVNLDQLAPANGLVVRYVVSGTAVAGKDYTTLSSQVTVPANSRSADITIAPIDDLIYNGPAPRTVSVALVDITSARVYSVGKPSGATVTINDNEAPPVPVATLVVSDGDAGEPNNPGQFQIKLDSAPGGNGLTVTYNVAGSAVADKDYKKLTGSVFFGPQVTSTNIDVAIIDDLVYNGVNPRNVAVTIASGNGYNVGSANNGSITIKDNETPPLPVATLVVSDGGAGEPSNAGQFQIKLDAAPGNNGLTINYNISGSAVAGKDYQALSGSVTFGPQATFANIDVTPIDDQIYNGTNPRTVAVTIASGNGYNIGNAANGSITIKDNEAPPLPIATLVVSDGDAGEPSNAGQFQIKLDAAPGNNGLTINYNISGSAVAGKDYQSLSGSVTFGPQATSANIDVNPIDDQIYNGASPRTVAVTISSGTGYNIGNAADGSVTIKDNEAPPLPVATLVVSDGDAGEPSNAGQFQIKLDAAPGGNGATVNYTISGSAVASKDYQPLSGSVTFGPQATSANIDVTVIDDLIYNGPNPRNVVVTLGGAAGYTVGSANSASITIKDNEISPLPVATLSVSDADAGEPNNAGAFTVTLNQPAGANGLTVGYVVEGTAVANQDYQTLSGKVKIPANGNTATISVIPINDQIYNGTTPRTVNVRLIVLSDIELDPFYSVGEQVSGTITIKDDEAAPLPLVVSVQTVDPNATAGGSSGAFAIILNQPAPTNGLAVSYTTSGSARADQDYIALAGKAVIAAGATQAIVLVTPIANTTTQGSKTVELLLAPSEGYRVASEVPATITISRDVPNSDSNNTPGAPATGSNPLTIERVVGELQQTTRVGADVPFTVRVIDSSGHALANVTMAWSLDATGTAAGGTLQNATTTTDNNGAANVTLHTGPLAANYVLTARASTTINNLAASVSETFSITAGLVKIVSPNTPESAIAQALDQLCPTLNSNNNRTASQQLLLDRCTTLYGALANSSDAEVLQALRALAPEELSVQGTLAHEVMRTQIDNIAERLRALRRGSKQLSLGSLSLNIDDQNVPGSVLETITQQAIGAAAGDEGQDSIWRDERLGVFVSGEINHGKRSQTERESDFSFDTRGITFGVDYRISDAVVVGGALGYAGTDVTLGSSGGNLDAKGQIISIYGSWQWDTRWSLDGVLSYGKQDFATQRVIDYTINGSRTLLYADGDNSSANIALSASLNYALTAQNDDIDASSGISSELFARLDHTRSHIDGYTESGADELNLQINEQQVQTWHLAFGVDWSKAISRTWGIITPQASVSWEFDGSDAYNINGYFVSDPNATMWSLTTDSPDRGYFRANAGVSALYSNGWSWFAQYETQFQRDNFGNHGWHGGLRYSRRF